MMFVNGMAKLKTLGAGCDESAEGALVASVLFSVLQNRLILKKGTDFS